MGWTETSHTPPKAAAIRKAPAIRKTPAPEPEPVPRVTAPVRPLKITTPAFDVRGRIPAKFTPDGADVSPALSWSNVPRAAKSLALIVEDSDTVYPDPVCHWLVYRIPPDASGIPEGCPEGAELEKPSGAVHGTTSSGVQGYTGPVPPRSHGEHHYHFRLYALDIMIDAPPGLRRKELMELIRGHVVATTEVVGTYKR